ncbi:MAG: efflux RND transporter permease subunit, partial [Candidatus Mucispirillum faecigallinarum]|nr:efflux RND transporter permease subunit [Candidatus Mucispirillum faecigallinarum]
STYWRGASPYEVEKEILERQERVLKTIPGLIDCESTARESSAYITLMFDMDVSVNDAMLLVSNKLNEVSGYPENMNQPTIRAANTDAVSVVDLMLLTDDTNKRSIDEYLSFFEETIKPYFDRVKGVADVSYWGGRAKQIQIDVDPYRLSAYNITLSAIINALSKENVNISAGTIDFGAKDYRFRTIGEAKTPQDIRDIVVISGDNSRIKLGDIANVDYGFSKRNTIVSYGNTNALSVGIVAQAGANVLELTNDVDKLVEDLNNGILKSNGLKFVKISDQKNYILQAIALVKSNIIVGGLLAVVVLLVFLRSLRATLVIAVTIPICIIGTFLIMSLLGRTLNVISLAGIAFSVGMLIDNSIVVLENIDRHIRNGKKALAAAIDATKEVWGAVLASTLTTIAVFLPIVFIKEEAGQLFGDIAIAVSAAVGLSLFTSITVIPVLSKILFSSLENKNTDFFSKFSTKFHISSKTKETLIKYSPNNLLVSFGSFFVKYIVLISDKINSKFIYKSLFIILVTAFSIFSAYTLMPKMDYLPLGNKNMMESRFTPPPGISYNERKAMGDFIYRELKPYMEGEKDGYPQIDNFVFIASSTYVALRATSKDESRVAELQPLLASVSAKLPGITASTSQVPLFNIGRGSSNTFLMNVTGAMDYESLVNTVRLIQDRIMAEIPDVQLRLNPTSNPVYPEVQIIPRREALKSAGVTATELGISVDAYLDGRKIGEFKDPSLGTIDIMLQGERKSFNNPEEVYSILVNSGSGLPVPISSLAETKEVMGIERVRRYNYQRSFLFIITLPKGMVLEQLQEKIDKKVIEPMRAEGLLQGITIYSSGASSKLESAKKALSGNFILAVLITYLLMAALLNNFFYPFIIMFAVPL